MNCEVFLLCDNEATTTYDAGPLGEVPACQRCADKMELLEAKFLESQE